MWLTRGSSVTVKQKIPSIKIRIIQLLSKEPRSNSNQHWAWFQICWICYLILTWVPIEQILNLKHKQQFHLSNTFCLLYLWEWRLNGNKREKVYHNLFRCLFQYWIPMSLLKLFANWKSLQVGVDGIFLWRFLIYMNDRFGRFHDIWGVSG